MGATLSESRKVTQIAPIVYSDAVEMVKRTFETQKIQLGSVVVGNNIAEMQGIYDNEKKEIGRASCRERV